MKLQTLFCAILFSITTTAFAANMKALSSAMHGKRMIVEYSVLNSGKHVLHVRDIKAKPETGAVQTVALNLKKGEHFADPRFKCETQSREIVYGVFSEKKASPTGAFQPERAWLVDSENLALIPVKETKSVICRWEPGSSEKFPFAAN